MLLPYFTAAPKASTVATTIELVANIYVRFRLQLSRDMGAEGMAKGKATEMGSWRRDCAHTHTHSQVVSVVVVGTA